jgi:hypothetical protein
VFFAQRGDFKKWVLRTGVFVNSHLKDNTPYTDYIITHHCVQFKLFVSCGKDEISSNKLFRRKLVRTTGTIGDPIKANQNNAIDISLISKFLFFLSTVDNQWTLSGNHV